MTKLSTTALLLALVSTRADAQINAGKRKPEPGLPFTITRVSAFNLPWRVAFLPDGRMLVTEKVGPVWLVTERGEKSPVANVPAVLHQGQGGSSVCSSRRITPPTTTSTSRTPSPATADRTWRWRAPG